MKQLLTVLAIAFLPFLSFTQEPLTNLFWVQSQGVFSPRSPFVPVIDIYDNIVGRHNWGGGVVSSIYPSKDGYDWAELMIFGSKGYSFSGYYMQAELGAGFEYQGEEDPESGPFRGSAVLSLEKENGMESFIVFERNIANAEDFNYIGSCMFPIKNLKPFKVYSGFFAQKDVYWGVTTELRLKKFPLTIFGGGGWNLERRSPGSNFGVKFQQQDD